MEGRSVLIVDDSMAVRRAVCLMLGADDYECIEAEDGEQALSVLQTKSVDVVLTDLHMPKCDGFELIARLRQIPAHRFTPVLVLTTECRDEVIGELKRAGVTGVLQKPIEREGLYAALKRCFS